MNAGGVLLENRQRAARGVYQMLGARPLKGYLRAALNSRFFVKLRMEVIDEWSCDENGEGNVGAGP